MMITDFAGYQGSKGHDKNSVSYFTRKRCTVTKHPDNTTVALLFVQCICTVWNLKGAQTGGVQVLF